MNDELTEAPLRALDHWPGMDGAQIEPVARGLINETFFVTAGAERFVLQRLNPIFDARIHENIQAVTERLAQAGLMTPRLLPTREGRPWSELDDGAWRLMTHVAGANFDALQSPEQARSAGALVARFHDALDQLPHVFVAMRSGVHDTPRHLATLREALVDHPTHRLHAEVAALAADLFAAIDTLPPLTPEPPRVCHGDLKVSNVMFAGEAGEDRDRAVCLIDLDTVGPLPLAYELGDAWRSWCNPSHEDEPEPAFDLTLFQAAWEGYEGGVGRPSMEATRRNLLIGVEWITAELSARFAADGLRESYFGFDRSRYPAAGEHNLARARGQWALHRSTRETHAARSRILGLRD